MSVILEEQQRYLQSFINNATYHPMNPDTDVTYQTVNLFSTDKCFTCFISDCPHYIRWKFITIPKYKHIIAAHVSSKSIFTWIVQTVLCWFKSAQHCLYNSGKDRCLYLEIVFVLLFKIENAVYTCFQNCMLLFINGFIFDIINIQNN